MQNTILLVTLAMSLSVTNLAAEQNLPPSKAYYIPTKIVVGVEKCGIDFPSNLGKLDVTWKPEISSPPLNFSAIKEIGDTWAKENISSEYSVNSIGYNLKAVPVDNFGTIWMYLVTIGGFNKDGDLYLEDPAIAVLMDGNVFPVECTDENAF